MRNIININKNWIFHLEDEEYLKAFTLLIWEQGHIGNGVL